MRNDQRGITLTGLIVGAVVLVLGAVLAMKLAPPYLEFFNAKKLIAQIASEGKTSVDEIRKSFDLKSSIDDVTTITSIPGGGTIPVPAPAEVAGNVDQFRTDADRARKSQRAHGGARGHRQR